MRNGPYLGKSLLLTKHLMQQIFDMKVKIRIELRYRIAVHLTEFA